MQPIAPVLDSSHLALINEALQHVAQAQEIQAVRKKAGVDTTDMDVALAKGKHYLTTVKNHYFPPGSGPHSE